jgi:hypothetical protein
MTLSGLPWEVEVWVSVGIGIMWSIMIAIWCSRMCRQARRYRVQNGAVEVYELRSAIV